jgi:hypothetical protein
VAGNCLLFFTGRSHEGRQPGEALVLTDHLLAQYRKLADSKGERDISEHSCQVAEIRIDPSSLAENCPQVPGMVGLVPVVLQKNDITGRNSKKKTKFSR